MQTIEQSLRTAEAKLKRAGIGSARLDVLILLEEATGRDRAHLLANPEIKLNARSRKIFNNLVSRRAKRVPIAYLVGEKEFYWLKFKVTPQVLIPRPETEAVVETALSLITKLNKKPTALLDIGTGCGAIAIAIAKQRPHWRVAASDVSATALRVARLNAELRGVEMDFYHSDLFGAIQGQFNIITANLPYVRAGAELSPEGKREPAMALYGGTDGLDIYRRFLATAPKHLTAGGHLVIEAEPRQHPELIKIAHQQGLDFTKTIDFALSFSLNPKP